MLRYLSLVLVAALLSACGGGRFVPGVTVPSGAASFGAVARNDIPPRLQWMYNHGYCGETSLISAGLYYGQYLSQYDARRIANPGIPQNDKASQLLLSANAERAARRMHLLTHAYDGANRSSREFLAWVGRNVARGYPVAIGVYMNEYYFYHKRRAGDRTYDHIVPIVAVGNDTITFSDNGLNAPGAGPIGPHPGDWRPLRKYLYTYRVSSFVKTREQANDPSAPPYSLPRAGRSPLPADYAVAVTGVSDPEHETLPVRVATNKYYEWPPIAQDSNHRPTAEALTLTVTVSGLTPGVSYTLYRYDDFGAVPDVNFNARARQASQHWRFRIRFGNSYTVRQAIESDQTVIYRAVPSSGP